MLSHFSHVRLFMIQWNYNQFFLSFLMWAIFKVFIEFVTTLLLFCVLVFWPQGMWYLSSLTKGGTHISSNSSQILNHQITTRGNPGITILPMNKAQSLPGLLWFPLRWALGPISHQLSILHLHYLSDKLSPLLSIFHQPFQIIIQITAVTVSSISPMHLYQNSDGHTSGCSILSFANTTRSRLF